MPRVELNIRRAKRHEVLYNNDLRIGLVYFVKSVITEDVYCGALETGDWTNKKEFSTWFKQGRIYVIDSPLTNNVTEKTIK